MKKFKNVNEVSIWRLCVGCGACKYICPESKIELLDIIDEGIRPFLSSENCYGCTECIQVCPGISTIIINNNTTTTTTESDPIKELTDDFGQILEIWEGYASDDNIRFKGSSGGSVSALALYCLENLGMAGVLHVGAKNKEPWKNSTVISKNREEILSRTGSRYSPASPCDSLEYIENASNPFVFIGKPCDILGLKKAQSMRQNLSKNVGVAIGIFCAGTPSTKGTLDLLKYFKTGAEEIEEIRYRGKGWPGQTTIKLKKRENYNYAMTYKNSWGLLNKYRPFRCYLCPDCTSEFADISCGDPWYREKKEDEKGFSLVLVRTEKGREIIRGAIDAGYLSLKKVNPKTLKDSQKNLILKRGAIWGRLFTMKAFGIPVPHFRGFPLFINWLTLPIREKLKSILGTARRIIKRQYYKPQKTNIIMPPNLVSPFSNENCCSINQKNILNKTPKFNPR